MDNAIHKALNAMPMILVIVGAVTVVAGLLRLRTDKQDSFRRIVFGACLILTGSLLMPFRHIQPLPDFVPFG